MTRLHLVAEKIKYSYSLTGCGLSRSLLLARDSSSNLVAAQRGMERTERGKRERWCATRSRREIQVGRCWGVRKRVERRRGRVEYDKTSIPLMETNPPLRAPSPPPCPPRRAGRQFVRVYPTYPDISTLRPGGGLGSHHPPTFLSPSLIPPSLPSCPTCIPLIFSLTSPSFSPFHLSIFILVFVWVFLFLLARHSSLLYCPVTLFSFYRLRYLSSHPLSFRSVLRSLLLREIDPPSHVSCRPLCGEIIKLTTNIHHEV